MIQGVNMTGNSDTTELLFCACPPSLWLVLIQAWRLPVATFEHQELLFNNLDGRGRSSLMPNHCVFAIFRVQQLSQAPPHWADGNTHSPPAWCLCVCFCSTSPSLECDSGEEEMLGSPYAYSSLKQNSILQSSSGEERDSFDTSPDLSRTLSDSTHDSTKVSARLAQFPLVPVKFPMELIQPYC